MGTARKMVIFLFAIVVLYSCRTTRYVPVEKVITKREILRDTVVEYRLTPYNDSIAVRDTVSILENAYALSIAAYIAGVMHHSLKIKESPIKIPLRFTEVRISETVPKINTVEVPVYVNRLTTWQRIRINIANAAILTLLLVIIYYRKKY